MTLQIFGLPVSAGVVIGRAVLIASSQVDVAHYFVDAAQVDREIARFHAALQIVICELSALKQSLSRDTSGELSAMLDVHLMLLRDDVLITAINQWIQSRHYNAEWAISAQLEFLTRQFDEMDDDYLRERKTDVEQLFDRIQHAMKGSHSPLASPDGGGLGGARGPEPLVIVANNIAPADMLHFNRGIFGAFITEAGGKTSHTAIVARGLAVPAIVGLRDAGRIICPDEVVIVDGDDGCVFVDSSEDFLREYRARQLDSYPRRSQLSSIGETTFTLDGEEVVLLANIELPSGAAEALRMGAQGVGLFRSEFLFINKNGALPGEEEQFEAYLEAILAMKGLPVTIRTVDIGADKLLERPSSKDQRYSPPSNPALGLRAIRWSLTEPGMFRQQLRAILRAGAFGKVKLLLPMISSLSEVKLALAAISRARQSLSDAGLNYGHIEVGAMIEVPAAVLILPHILRYFDFISIGTNDLIQYTLAVDRTDEALAHLHDPWHPAVLMQLVEAISQAAKSKKEVSVCGEIAGDLEFTELLLGMGLRKFSMHPSRISEVRRLILAADSRKLVPYIEKIITAEDPWFVCSGETRRWNGPDLVGA
jgi:phosphoenolpyruvate-protein phosphotransferase (PTS system enzyme I)